MGFFDTYEDTSSGNWIAKDEKQELIENGTPLTVSAVGVEDSPQYGERYVLTVTIGDDTEERRLSFPRGSVESRDRMLDAMEKWLDDDGSEQPVVVIEKVGRSNIVRAFSA